MLWYSRKNYIYVLQVPLPSLMNLLFTNEPRLSLASPVYFSSWIKLVALTWGLVKFTKLRFFWPCLPLNPKHDAKYVVKLLFLVKLFQFSEKTFVAVSHLRHTVFAWWLSTFVIFLQFILSSRTLLRQDPAGDKLTLKSKDYRCFESRF